MFSSTVFCISKHAKEMFQFLHSAGYMSAKEFDPFTSSISWYVQVRSDRADPVLCKWYQTPQMLKISTNMGQTPVITHRKLNAAEKSSAVWKNH